MATIATLKDAIRLCRRANVVLSIWGVHGIGKSSIVRQVAEADKLGFMDFRLAQIEAADLRGLPDKQDGMTVFLPPKDLPRDLPDQPKSEGILFLDEINRAADDVINACFQLVLERQLGDYKLPPGWQIVVACNPHEGGYRTNGFTDPAFLDRFCHITLSNGDSTYDEWVCWMSDEYGDVCSEIVEFCSLNMRHLDGHDKTPELGFTVEPSRRSWAAAARVLKHAGQHSDEAVHTVLSGLLGGEVAIAFRGYKCPVKPRDILRDGVQKHLTVLKTLKRDELASVSWGLVSCAKTRSITEEPIANVALDFADFIMRTRNGEKDIASAFCRAMSAGQASLSNAAMNNPKLASVLNKFGATNAFLDGLVKRPELQKLLVDATWHAP